MSTDDAFVPPARDMRDQVAAMLRIVAERTLSGKHAYINPNDEELRSALGVGNGHGAWLYMRTVIGLAATEGFITAIETPETVMQMVGRQDSPMRFHLTLAGWDFIKPRHPPSYSRLGSWIVAAISAVIISLLTFVATESLRRHLPQPAASAGAKLPAPASTSNPGTGGSSSQTP